MVASTFAQVNTKEERQKWEHLFDVNYIEPVLEHLEKKLKRAMDLVANDDKQGEFIHLVICVHLRMYIETLHVCML